MGRSSSRGANAKFGNKRPNTSKLIADERGIHAIRRSLTQQSEEYIGQAFDDGLVDEVNRSGRLFLPETLGITVVGFTRYSRRYIERGPSTADLIYGSVFADKTITANLGRLMMIGPERKPNKLAIELHSDELKEETDEYSSRLAEMTYPLKPDFNSGNPDGSTTQHLTIGMIYSDRIGHFCDGRVLSRLDGVLGVVGQEVSLSPPNRIM